MVFIIGNPRIAHSEASAQAALDLMTFYAQIQGIGSCLWGAGKMILDRKRDARERLGLQGREHILGILLLGYPALEFRNKVQGRTLPIVWNGGREPTGRGSRTAPTGNMTRTPVQKEWHNAT